MEIGTGGVNPNAQAQQAPAGQPKTVDDQESRRAVKEAAGSEARELRRHREEEQRRADQERARDAEDQGHVDVKV